MIIFSFLIFFINSAIPLFGMGPIDEVIRIHNAGIDALSGDISGHIQGWNGSNMGDVTVHLSGPVNLMTTTDMDGDYTFIGVPNGSYTICPERISACSLGVTIFDVGLIRSHILTINPLGSPYKIMAADVTGDGESNPDPDTGDMIAINQLMLNIINEFPNGVPCWEFVPANHVFVNPSDPWDPVPPPTCITVNVSDNNVTGIDFIGIKKGDVNGSF